MSNSNLKGKQWMELAEKFVKKFQKSPISGWVHQYLNQEKGDLKSLFLIEILKTMPHYNGNIPEEAFAWKFAYKNVWSKFYKEYKRYKKKKDEEGIDIRSFENLTIGVDDNREPEDIIAAYNDDNVSYPDHYKAEMLLQDLDFFQEWELKVSKKNKKDMILFRRGLLLAFGRDEIVPDKLEEVVDDFRTLLTKFKSIKGRKSKDAVLIRRMWLLEFGK